jgi:molybdopterin-synthase adenylyltransferase
VDRDFIEQSNLQRQTLFDEDDVRSGLPKAVAAANKLSAVNSEILVEPQPVDFQGDNAERLVRDVDLVMDGTDNFEARYLINDVCVMLNKPWIYSAAVGSYGVTMNVRPRTTACFRCVFPDVPPPGTTASCDTAGVIGPIGGVIGSFASSEALKLLVGAVDKLRAGLLWVDVWNDSFQSTPMGGPAKDCRTCQLAQYEYLEAGPSSRTAVLCGRSSVQVRPREAHPVAFEALAERLKPLGEVSWNPYLLRFNVDGYRLTLFPDGRAIINGTEDAGVARSLYARYIGT